MKQEPDIILRRPVLIPYRLMNCLSLQGKAKKSFGNGSAYYIGCYTDKETLKDIYQKASQDAGIHKGFKEAAWPLIIRSGVNQHGKCLHYVLNYSEVEQQMENLYEYVQDLLTGISFKKGEKIHLADWGVAILEEQEWK
ncbi:hypothetical protein IMSAG249_02421 [Lachnospiraceae bacterium]|nr:hypothetical protein IMSAG249_02421 [Lachnospiraceae bacterium]